MEPEAVPSIRSAVIVFSHIDRYRPTARRPTDRSHQ